MTLPPPLLGLQTSVRVCLGLKLLAVTVAVTGSPTSTSFGCNEQVTAGPAEYSHLCLLNKSDLGLESLCATAPLETSDTARLRSTRQNRSGCVWAMTGMHFSITTQAAESSLGRILCRQMEPS